jgi:hypothetical protein
MPHGQTPDKVRGALDRASRDALGRLLLAAQEDAALRRQLLFLLRAPSLQRESLVNTAVHEMTLRGESADARTAFALLGSEQGARVALDFLQAP